MSNQKELIKTQFQKTLKDLEERKVESGIKRIDAKDEGEFITVSINETTEIARFPKLDMKLSDLLPKNDSTMSMSLGKSADTKSYTIF